MEKHLANQLQEAWEDVSEQVETIIHHSEHFAELLRRCDEGTMANKFELYFVNTLKGFQTNMLQVTASELQDTVENVVTEILTAQPEEDRGALNSDEQELVRLSIEAQIQAYNENYLVNGKYTETHAEQAVLNLLKSLEKLQLTK